MDLQWQKHCGFPRSSSARFCRIPSEGAILDEPISALNVSVPAQVLNFLADLCTEFELSYLFISYALPLLKRSATGSPCFASVQPLRSDRQKRSSPLRESPKPTSSPRAPAIGRPWAAPEAAGTELPDLLNPPPGCTLAARCLFAMENCRANGPKLRPVGERSDAAASTLLDKAGPVGPQMHNLLSRNWRRRKARIWRATLILQV